LFGEDEKTGFDILGLTEDRKIQRGASPGVCLVSSQIVTGKKEWWSESGLTGAVDGQRRKTGVEDPVHEVARCSCAWCRRNGGAWPRGM